MIDATTKRALGQLTNGVHVVACASGDLVRGFTSTWVCQVAFEEPIIMVSVSPKHDTYRVIEEEGWVTVSLLAGDQIEQGQYFSYPGRHFRHIGDYFETVEGRPVIRDCVSWLYGEVVERIPMRDHVLLIVEVAEVGEGRLKEPALTYSSRKGWRIADTPARRPGESVRDKLLAMLERAED